MECMILEDSQDSHEELGPSEGQQESELEGLWVMHVDGLSNFIGLEVG